MPTEISGSESGSLPVSSSPQPPKTFWGHAYATLGDAVSMFMLGVLLYLAIGLVCEIYSRREDKERVVARFNWLVACQAKPESDRDKGCPADTANQIGYATNQIRDYDSLNSIGAADRCGIAAVVASQYGHFKEDCIALKQCNSSECIAKLSDKDNVFHLQPIIDPPFGSYSGAPLRLDQRPKEDLYFWLVLVAAAIGSLMRGLQNTKFTSFHDLGLGLCAGFAVYLLLRGGNVAFFASTTPVDVLNPYTTAAAGLLAGLLTERVLPLFGGVLAKPQNATS